MDANLKLIAQAPNSGAAVLIVDHYHVGQRIALLQLNQLRFCGHVVTSCRQAIRAFGRAPYAVQFPYLPWKICF